MEEIELSVMPYGSKTLECLQTLLNQFEAQTRTHVNLQMLDWETSRSELNKIAIYHHGPDVSVVGTTWIGDFIAMNALRPFKQGELAKIGDASEFLSSSWQSGTLQGSHEMWAIPWLGDTRVIHYRRDLLKSAGVDESKAFLSHADIEQTIQKLVLSGVPSPLAFPRTPSKFILHNLASWVWNAGGDFCSQDGKQVLFDQPEALKGMQQFFGLLRFMTPAALKLVDEFDTWGLFLRGDAAIGIDSVWSTFPYAEVAPEIAANWGMASIPGALFVGGTDLAIWSHTRHEQAAFELVRFLASNDAQAYLFHTLGVLPTRLKVLNSPEFSGNPNMRGIPEALIKGRSYPTAALWGLIEDKLTDAVLQIWSEVLSDPEIDLDATLRRHLEPLAMRLNLTMANYSGTN
jgi:multiple sugar transport system substrate-binding protein